MSKRYVKIAYIGGGSRDWAWDLMRDLATAKKIEGEVALYDIDFPAAKANEVIGNRINQDHPEAAKWSYKAFENIGDALKGAEIVVISILPGTFDEMESDVHTPEKYGIYQSVGDTVGPGGIIRCLRTVPMFVTIAEAVRDYCPDAWVINYTNPMTVCVRTLYKTFPKIKAFGCCHEVFSTQRLLMQALKDVKGIDVPSRKDIVTDIYGINHFTWVSKARYGNMDLYPVYAEYIKGVEEGKYECYFDCGAGELVFNSHEMVKFDLFKRYGIMAAAGDRHLAEFCPIEWYMKDEKQVEDWGYALTPVSWRKENLKHRLEMSKRLYNGEDKFELYESGEEGVQQIEAVLGLGDMITNVNLPNVGQIPNLPMGAVVETNAIFRNDSVLPVTAGELPDEIYALTAPIVAEQEMVVDAGMNKDLDLAFKAFSSSNHMPIPVKEARELFDEMVRNTAKYLDGYKLP